MVNGKFQRPILVVAVCVASSALYFALRPKDSFADAGTMTAAAIGNRDWGSIYDSAALTETRVLGPTREQYVTLANALTGSIKLSLKPVRFAPATDLKGASRPMIFAAFGHEPKFGQPYCFPVHFRRGSKQTHPDALTVLLGINSLGGGDEKEQLKRLYEAMKAANVKQLTDFTNDAVLKDERILAASQGKLSPEDIWGPG